MAEIKKRTNRSQERRNYDRLKKELRVALCPSKYLLEHDALSHDISEGGICVFTNNVIEIGEDLKLKIHLPGLKGPVSALGKIVRRNETKDTRFIFMLGIRFTDIKPKEHALISNHLRYYVLKD